MKNIKTKNNMKKERGKMMEQKLVKLVFSFLVLFIFTSRFVVAQTNSDQYKTYLHNPSVGDVPELETYGEYRTELFPGAGTYTYVIETPPGTTGLQPLVSLFYNSQSVLQRPGILGNGWSLTEGSIIRNVNHTVNNTNDDYFVLTLSNNRLRVFYNGSAYNTEINPRQYRIQNFTNSGKIYWIVTTTDGTQYRFG